MDDRPKFMSNFFDIVLKAEQKADKQSSLTEK